MVGDDRVFVYGGYLDRNLELFRSKRTSNFRCFRSGVIRSLRIDNVFLLFVVIQGCTGLYLDRCILVAQLDDFKRAVESRVVTARNIHQRVGVGILVSFIGNVGYFDGAARYRIIQFVHREVCFCYRRLVVDRNDIDLCCEFNRRVATCTVTDNFVFERCVVAAEFILRCLVGEFAQIGYSNHLAFGYGDSVVNECSRRREPRDDNGGERLRSMLEVEFRFSKHMLFIFVDVDNEIIRYGRRNFGILDENVEASVRIVIVVSGEFSSRNVTNDEPKFFTTCSAVFDKTVD